MSQLNVYRWRKRDTIACDHSFLEKLSESPLEDMTHLQYFSIFITTALLDIVVEKTNILVFKLFINPSIQTVQKYVFDWDEHQNYHPINLTGAENFVVQE